MPPLIDQSRSEIALLCHRYGVRQLEVFGSAARGADFDPEASDADVLVAFGAAGEMSPLQRFFGFAEGPERPRGRSVDLADWGAIEANGNTIRRRHILGDTQAIHG